MPPYSGVKSLGTAPDSGVEATALWLEVVVSVCGVGLWWVDGRPGIDRLRSAIP